ncbi:MAG: Hpt domain-containing protein [Shewanella sp.]|nr:Hpt domain-containing protein [Shewanella sp.]MCF1430076.1 Hpt domain-containing protein [Shewanella sp.]MCF1438037.1 Hpt domain-containing protein [Shewanella sp.]MCF1456369.1 Hpt domain-containing protein [Shewanella sp.]
MAAVYSNGSGVIMTSRRYDSISAPNDTPTKLIDLNKALSTLMEDAELLRVALQLFTEEMTVLLAQCERAIQAGDLLKAAEICHTLKGAPANLSMQPLTDKAKEIG